MADKIHVERRESFGKGASRQLRRDGRTPAVVYGHGSEPVHISFDSHEIFLATKGQANPILTISLEGKDQLVLVKELQRNPLSRIIEHLDLLRVAQGEKVEVEVPVEISGESFPGTIHTVELMHVLVKAPATAIPEAIVVDVEGRKDGENVTVADLTFPQGVEVETDPEAIVVVISTPSAPSEADLAPAESAEASEEASE
jgi:ribosomal protein L25, Ctc-form